MSHEGECNLVPYPTDYHEPAQVLLGYFTGHKPETAEVAHAAYQLQGVALGALLPHGGDQPIPPGNGDQGEGDEEFERPDGFKGTPPRRAAPDPQSDPRPSPAHPVKGSPAGLRGTQPPQTVTREQCCHVLEQVTGARAGQGPTAGAGPDGGRQPVGGWLSGEFAKKLLAVALKVLFELQNS